MILEPGAAGTFDLGSAVLSSVAFRGSFCAGSGTEAQVSTWKGMVQCSNDIRPETLCLVGTTDDGIARELLSAADSSDKPRPMADSAGSLLGGLMPVGFCECIC